MERGVIDAGEWLGPYDDMKLGLHKTARHYYYPGWQEPGAVQEFSFNKKAYEALPIDLRRTLDHAAAAVQVYGLTEHHAKNAIALERLNLCFPGSAYHHPGFAARSLDNGPNTGRGGGRDRQIFVAAATKSVELRSFSWRRATKLTAG
jgi:Bacterial extracellular solute-binding protein, family 7